MSLMERVWFAWLWARAGVGRGHRQGGWGLIEFAIGALVLALGASIGLKVLAGDLSKLFSDLGSSLQMPAGGIGGG
jgi:hypothetical protein